MSLSRRTPATLAVAAALVVAAAGCTGAHQTEVVISVATDLALPDEIDELGLYITYADDTSQALVDLGWELDRNLPDAIALPARFGILAGKDPSRVVRYTVRGLAQGHVYVDRRASLPFVHDRIILLRMNLLRRCVGVTCQADETCGEHGCEKIAKNPADLPDHSPDAEISGYDAHAADAFYVDHGGRDGPSPSDADAAGDAAGDADAAITDAPTDGAPDGDARRDAGADSAGDSAPPDQGPRDSTIDADGTTGTTCPFFATTSGATIAGRRLRLAVSDGGVVWIISHPQPTPSSTIDSYQHDVNGFSAKQTITLPFAAGGADIAVIGTTQHLFFSEYVNPPTIGKLIHRFRFGFNGAWQAPDVEITSNSSGIGGGAVAAVRRPNGATMRVIAAPLRGGGSTTSHDEELISVTPTGSVPPYAYSSVPLATSVCSSCGPPLARVAMIDDKQNPTAYSVNGSIGQWRAARRVSGTTVFVSGTGQTNAEAPAVSVDSSNYGLVAWVEGGALKLGRFNSATPSIVTIAGHVGTLSQSSLEIVSDSNGTQRLVYSTVDAGKLRFWAVGPPAGTASEITLAAGTTAPAQTSRSMRAVVRDLGAGTRDLYIAFHAGSDTIALRCVPFP